MVRKSHKINIALLAIVLVNIIVVLSALAFYPKCTLTFIFVVLAGMSYIVHSCERV